MWLGIIRKWRPVLGWWSLICLAAACGGGKGGTGPGGGGGGGEFAGDYLLAGANDEAVPTVINSDVCARARIVNGGMTLNANGQWQMQFNWQNDNGEDKFTGDHGHWRATNGGVEFTSDTWGDSFEGEMDDGLLWIAYDFCSDDPPGDLELAFSR